MNKKLIQIDPITTDVFFKQWDSTKANSNNNKQISEIINFFKPFVDTIPKLALGEFYWQIFNNAQPIPKILMIGGDVEKLTPTNSEGLINMNFSDFFAFFHPDDLNQTLTYVSKIFEMLFGMEAENRSNFNFTIYTRIRNYEGEFIWNSLQYPAIYFDENDTYLFGMALYTNVNHLLKPDAEPMLTVLDSSN